MITVSPRALRRRARRAGRSPPSAWSPGRVAATTARRAVGDELDAQADARERAHDLRKALVHRRLASDNIFDRMQRLMEIAILINENRTEIIERLGGDSCDQTARDLVHLQNAF